MRKPRKQGYYWDEYKDYSLDLTFDETDYNELNIDSLSFNDEKEFIIKDDTKKNDIHQGWGDDKGKILIDDNNYILKLV